MTYFKIISPNNNCSVRAITERVALMLGQEMANLSNDLVFVYKQHMDRSICWTSIMPDNTFAL